MRSPTLVAIAAAADGSADLGVRVLGLELG
jgi:hypothetical protein